METTLQFVLSCWGQHEVATFAACINLDACDIDLSAGEYERVSGRAALEVAGATPLTGVRLGRGGACPVRGWIALVILAEVRRRQAGRSGGLAEGREVGRCGVIGDNR